MKDAGSEIAGLTSQSGSNCSQKDQGRESSTLPALRCLSVRGRDKRETLVEEI